MNDVAALLKEMVAIPSVSCGLDGEPDEVHGEARMVAFVSDFFDRHGIDYETQEVEPGRENVLGFVEGGDGPSLLLEAHTDTVSVDGMTIDPFVPDERDGKIYGRGSCDDKASLAAMLTGLVRAKEKGLPGDVTLAMTADEECGFGGARHLVQSGVQADGAVVGEPTELRLVVAHKGSCRATIRTIGLTAHTSDPSRGENAIYSMGCIIPAMEEYAETLTHRPPHELVGGPTCAVSMISGGQAPNVVPDLCELTVDRRVIPGETTEQVFSEIKAAAARGAGEREWEAELFLDDPPLETPSNAWVARLVARAIEYTGGDSAAIGVQFGTDASKFAEAGIPSVVIGPGSIKQAHTNAEFVEIRQVTAAARLYERICTLPRGG